MLSRKQDGGLHVTQSSSKLKSLCCNFVQGHGDVLSLDFSSNDSVKWPDFAEDNCSSKAVPTILNRLGLRMGGKENTVEGMLLASQHETKAVAKC